MNPKDINSNQFPQVYEALGIDVNHLGCIMLDTENIPILDYADHNEGDLYWAANKNRFWIRGPVAEHGAHLTLLFGLMDTGSRWKAHVDAVLDGWEIPALEIEDIGVFESPFEDEPYACIIAHIKVTPELLEGHARLELLPHINTYTAYRPHVTLAYVRKGTEDVWVKNLSELVGKTLAVRKLNYGGSHD